MKTMFRLISLLLTIITVTSVNAKDIEIFGFKFQGGGSSRPKKIMLTGTLRENVEMTIGNTGRKEIIKSLPYEFKIPKDQLPVTLTFRSDNYSYYNIAVPRKPMDATGHIYIMKIDETNTNTGRVFANKQSETRYGDEDVNSYMEVQMTRSSDVDTDIPVTSKLLDNTFAVIIANENYEEPIEDVHYAYNDGEAFRDYCVKTLGIPLKHIRMRKDATLNNINSEVAWMQRIADAVGQEARFLFFYAGHGVPNGKDDAFLLPVDGDGSRPESGYSMRKLHSELGKLPAKATIVFMDACFSGAKRGGDGMVVATRGVAIRAKVDAPKGNVVVLSAAQGDETAHKYEEKKHGLFTYFLLKKLKESKGNVSLEELSKYVTQQVKRNSLLEEDKVQTPSTYFSPTMTAKWKGLQLNEE